VRTPPARPVREPLPEGPPRKEVEQGGGPSSRCRSRRPVRGPPCDVAFSPPMSRMRAVALWNRHRMPVYDRAGASRASNSNVAIPGVDMGEAWNDGSGGAIAACRPLSKWRSRAIRLGPIAFVLIAACEQRSIVSPTTRPSPSVSPQSNKSVTVDDPVMGNLSALARHVVGALRDSALRQDIARALKETESPRSGLDLQGCAPGSLSRRIMDEGERRGQGASAQMCGLVNSLHGAILYMAPERLAQWNGGTVPVVTAISDPQAPLPPFFKGYRSTSRVVDLSSTSPAPGPLLVILPFRHARRAARQGSTSSVKIIEVPRPDSSRKGP
jgi:hypothetical protein